MTKRMLIDGIHAEETRVVVLDGSRLDDFDYESASRRTLKGNIYLGKITRVEPSLQAAFVEYGGNRHGFLPFTDIHPDYYRIPIADREALIAEATAVPAAEELDPEHEPAPVANGEDHDPEESLETVGGDEVVEVRRRTDRTRRNYKIQEVIKRRQVVLVQVTKEERGTKGAALTTYISLAGRYCVLMPNTIRGGGISRKITDVKDRKRLKEIIGDLDLPEGMAIILRTAGVERTKTEIKRDHDFLMKVWDDIREKTLTSRAPELIYEEANLIKRTIRDVYSRDIEEVVVEGEDAYRTAKDFMRVLMPSHAKRVQLYKDRSVHLFPKFQVESQLEALHSAVVRLKSGGSLVIGTTEALVAIDVNSGRATRERHIEETALKTNLEAATEVARQLRLRDLAGLIVIDFIDMEDRRNNAAVERRLKEAMRLDRARVQIGRISGLGLLEMSRQRLRPSLFETSMLACPTCHGQGFIRSVESTALHVLRALEEDVPRRRAAEIAVYVTTPVALYILNQKRDSLYAFERQHGMRILVERDETLVSPAYRIEHRRDLPPPTFEHAAPEEEERVHEPEPPVEAEEAEPESQELPARYEARAEGEDEEGGKRRRRGRRGGRRRGKRREDEGEAVAARPDGEDVGQEAEEPVAAAPEPDVVPAAAEAEPQGAPAEAEAAGRPPRRRRPRRRRPAQDEAGSVTADFEAFGPVEIPIAETVPEPATEEHVAAEEPAAAESDAAPTEAVEGVPERAEIVPEEPAPEPAAPAEPTAPEAEAEPEPEPEPALAEAVEEQGPPREPRRGWWQRLRG